MDWTEEQIQAVWEKGKVIAQCDASVYRKDSIGKWIKRDKYGVNKLIRYQWEIHHKIRKADDGYDDIRNLEPLNGKAMPDFNNS